MFYKLKTKKKGHEIHSNRSILLTLIEIGIKNWAPKMLEALFHTSYWNILWHDPTTLEVIGIVT